MKKVIAINNKLMFGCHLYQSCDMISVINSPANTKAEFNQALFLVYQSIHPHQKFL
jgi:hypothetical protein